MGRSGLGETQGDYRTTVIMTSRQLPPVNEAAMMSRWASTARTTVAELEIATLGRLSAISHHCQWVCNDAINSIWFSDAAPYLVSQIVACV